MSNEMHVILAEVLNNLNEYDNTKCYLIQAGVECTPELKRAIPVCVTMIIRELNGGQDA